MSNTTLNAAWELHLRPSPEFTKKGYGRKVRALGGRWNECRGYAYKRFVTLPDTPAGRALADILIAEFGPRNGKGTTVISRGVIQAVYEHRTDYGHWSNMAWVEVQYVKPQDGEGVAAARAKCEKAAQQAVARGFVSGYKFASA